MATKRTAPPRGYVVYEGPSLLTGDPIVCVVTLHSSNRKTGNMLQSWILLQEMSPIAGSRTGADIAICGNCPSRGIAQPEATSGMAKKRKCYVDLGRAPYGIWDAYRRGIYPRLVGHTAIASIAAPRQGELRARFGSARTATLRRYRHGSTSR